ncbi:hypothetical protein HPB52_004499 [Rhipicephalus sanguineus]|uniref:Uncharacterized protein n=1 Tax=Rhipicephalus sanguineus TaxID=34632 RepID=A0A9D4QC27_RHISA|nr:hypothetical protein HPB52_004499 [Rhipicephalus sanguineus]
MRQAFPLTAPSGRVPGRPPLSPSLPDLWHFAAFGQRCHLDRSIWGNLLPFWELTLQNCHPKEPGTVYTDKERRLLCALRGVPEIHCSTHLTSDLHAEHAAAGWALRRLPTNIEEVLVLRTLRPDLLAHPQVARDDVILDMDAKTMCGGRLGATRKDNPRVRRADARGTTVRFKKHSPAGGMERPLASADGIKAAASLCGDKGEREDARLFLMYQEVHGEAATPSFRRRRTSDHRTVRLWLVGHLRSNRRQLPRRTPVDLPGLEPPFHRMGGRLEQRHEGLVTARMLAACFSRRDIQSDLQDSPPDWMETSSPVSLGLASRDRQGGKRRERMDEKTFRNELPVPSNSSPSQRRGLRPPAWTHGNQRNGSHPKLEEALNLWLSATVAKKIPVSGDLLKLKAETFALRMGITGWNGKSYVVDVLSAISILSDAWKAVTQETIRNCFRHAGFVNTEIGDEDSATDLDPLVESPPTAAADILDDLRASGVDVGAVDVPPSCGQTKEGRLKADKAKQLQEALDAEQQTVAKETRVYTRNADCGSHRNHGFEDMEASRRNMDRNIAERIQMPNRRPSTSGGAQRDAAGVAAEGCGPFYNMDATPTATPCVQPVNSFNDTPVTTDALDLDELPSAEDEGAVLETTSTASPGPASSTNAK